MRGRGAAGLVLALGAAAYLATGVHPVAPGEVGVVRRLGRVLAVVRPPGLHWGWPYGFDVVTKVRTEEVRRLDLGRVGPGLAGDDPGSGEYLTGDLNLVRAGATLQYRVADPVAFSLLSDRAEGLLRAAGEGALSRALAGKGVDAVLKEGRAAVARAVEAEAGRASERYGLGLAVLGLSLTDVRPPAEVAAEFAAAQSARSGHDRRVNEAQEYADTTVSAARAQSLAKAEQARAKADRTLSLAKGRAGSFLALLAEAEKDRVLTVRSVYMRALQGLWGKVGRKIVLAPEEAVDLSLFGGR